MPSLSNIISGGYLGSHLKFYNGHIPSHHLLIAMTPIIPKHNTFVHFFLHFTTISLKSKGTCACFFQQSLLANIHSANIQYQANKQYITTEHKNENSLTLSSPLSHHHYSLLSASTAHISVSSTLSIQHPHGPNSPHSTTHFTTHFLHQTTLFYDNLHYFHSFKLLMPNHPQIPQNQAFKPLSSP